MIKSFAWLLVLSILLGLPAPTRAQGSPEPLARQSAETWLAMTDAGAYARSHDEAAQYFRTAVGKEQWQAAMQGGRAPLGKMMSRVLKGATPATSLPGAPDGQYVVLQYETRFENKQAAVETVTCMLDRDGAWRVSGYFIR